MLSRVLTYVPRLACLAACAWLGGVERGSAAAVGSYFNGTFPAEAPGFASSWSTIDAFPGLTFIDPIYLAQVPGTNDLVVVTKGGKIWRFPNSPGVTTAQRSLVIDLGSKLQVSEDQGLYRIAFHPKFGQFGNPFSKEVYVSYSHRPASADAGPDKSMWRVSRFEWQAGTGGTIDPSSEVVLIQQFDPHRWHNAGALEFDNDGYLLVTCGDGGDANDSLGLAQKINSGFFGGVLRIDVDNNPARSHAIRRQPVDPVGRPSTFPISFTQGYGIPNDNPWLNANGSVLEEFYAIGLRSPHSAKYDPPTGELWVGDVGQLAMEEINRVVKGENYQWPFMQGTQGGPKAKPSAANLIGFEAGPVHSYGRTAGTCVIGGMRYRGLKWAADLGGDLIFGDNGFGSLSAATLRQGQVPAIQPLVTGLGAGIYSGISAIATDAEGEIYVLKLNGQGQDGGSVRKLVRSGTYPQPPALLSATGLFTNMASLTPAAALIPYEVASPLWSDGAAKKRWIALPNDGTHDTASEKISYSEEGNWSFPAGTVLVKHFEIANDERQPAQRRRLETRVMVCTADGGKYGVTYKWNAAGTDATLLTQGEQASYPYTRADGSNEMRAWSYPSRADCFQCHTLATGQSLGLRTQQLNHSVTNPANGLPGNQLSLFNGQNLLSPGLSGIHVDSLPRSQPLEDESAPLEHRLRSYLDANCAPCHQPGSSAPFFDARLTTPLRGQNLIEGLISGQFNLGPEGRYIRPGDTALSAIHVRMGSAVPGIAMPPLAKHVVDARAVELMEDYIAGLNASEFASGTTPQARYLRITSLNGSRAAIAELSVLDGRGMPLSGLITAGASSQDSASPGSRALDGDPSTYWMTTSAAAPHWLTIDLGAIREVGGFIYLPRQDNVFGRITSYKVELSADGTTWTSQVSGNWSNDMVSAFRYDEWNKPRPVRCQIGAPAQSRGSFQVTVIFDSMVQDFEIADLNVQGGTASQLRGDGYFYTAVVTPQITSVDSIVTVSVVADAVNPGGLGSRPASVTVLSQDSQGPSASTLSSGSPVRGLFDHSISFNEPVTGLEATDFKITNGVVQSFSGSGSSYTVRIMPDRVGDVIVELPAAACQDSGGNLSYSYFRRATGEAWYFLTRQSYERQSSIGMTYHVDSPPYFAADEGLRNGSQALDENWRVLYQFRITEAGAYRVRASTRADDPLSSSFYLGMNGHEPVVWNVNRGPGQIGSGGWYTEFAAGTGEPYVYQLEPGDQFATVYARDDGTKLTQIELVPLRPFPMWGSNAVATSAYPILLPLSFTDEVSGLTVEDFVMQGGRVVSLTGSGRSYQVGIAAEGRDLSIQLPADRCMGPEGHGNSASFAWRFIYKGPYETWALAAGLDDSAAGALTDADKDGVAQLLEYAFGMNPKIPDHNLGGNVGLPYAIMGQEGQGMVLRFVKRKNIAGLRYSAEFSGPDFTWSPATTAPVVEAIDANWERVTISDGEEPGARRRFGRVKVDFGSGN